MTLTKEIELSVLHHLAASETAEGDRWAEIRKASQSALSQTAFPHRKIEEWRRTDLRPITRTDFVPLNSAGVFPVADATTYFIPESENSRLVFVNGHFNKELSSLGSLGKGVTFGNLADYENHPVVREYLNKLLNYEDDVFSLYSGSFLNDGAFIHLEQNAKAEAPIQVLHLYTDSAKPFVAVPRLLVVAEEKSDLTIVEDHVGLGSNVYMTLPVSEVKVKQGAHIHHVRLQRDSQEAIHVSRPIAYVEKNAEYHAYTITLGAKLSRNEPRVVQEDEEVDFTLDGLVLIDGEQIADTHSVMDHRFSHAQSHQLHKVVVNGSAHSIFNGKIFVRKDAQKIDSFQENRNLLLSYDGLVNTKPQLEIFADDVLCSHGATIGQLDAEEVFYLQSRGMTEEKAKEVLTYAFALETIENVKIDSVHQLLIEEVNRYTKANNIQKEAV